MLKYCVKILFASIISVHSTPLWDRKVLTELFQTNRNHYPPTDLFISTSSLYLKNSSFLSQLLIQNMKNKVPETNTKDKMERLTSWIRSWMLALPKWPCSISSSPPLMDTWCNTKILHFRHFVNKKHEERLLGNLLKNNPTFFNNRATVPSQYR